MIEHPDPRGAAYFLAGLALAILGAFWSTLSWGSKVGFVVGVMGWQALSWILSAGILEAIAVGTALILAGYDIATLIVDYFQSWNSFNYNQMRGWRS